MSLEKMDLVMQNWNYKENKSGYLLQILIITYNHKDSIAKAIESVLEQDTNYQYEIIITDDCSTDGTTQICQEYAKKYPDKIRLLTQDKNTYCNFGRSIKKNHIYQALCSLDARYWCYLDGDDCWIDVNKIQIALDFLEQNQEYSIFAHDTLVKTANGSHSFVKDEQKVSEEVLTKEIYFSANALFFMSSSRIQRNIIDFKKEKIVFDYLFYYYTLSKGKAYYYDKPMAIYNMEKPGYWIKIGKKVRDINSMFPYKLCLMFNFKQDKFCTDLQKRYDKTNSIPQERYHLLCLLKKIFGIKLGWKLWFIKSFVPKYGLQSMNINYLYINRRNKK